MGVSYYYCEICNESRYEEYVGDCTSCNKSLCTRCLTNDDIESDYAFHYGVKFDGSDKMKVEYGITDEDIEKGYFTVDELLDDSAIDPKYCPFCQGEEVAEEDVFKWYLEKKKLNYDDLKAGYLKDKLSK